MNRSECIRALNEDYRARRERNEAELNARYDAAEKADPGIAALRAENLRMVTQAMRRMTDPGMTPEESLALGTELKRKGLANLAAMRARLKAVGLPEDYLEKRWRCEKCRDTGYLDDGHGTMCECYKNALDRMLYRENDIVDRQCFENFDLNVFPVENDQRRRMDGIRRVCLQYADSFPDTTKLNLVFTGESGLGKTYMLNCVYRRVVDRGFAATRLTAYRLLEAMRRQYMADSAEDMVFEPLLTTPLLLIDDLGSESKLRNITVEYLFILLNERMSAGLHTVIATNLSPQRLRDNYGDRICSRLLDRANCLAFEFKGKDLRTL